MSIIFRSKLLYQAEADVGIPGIKPPYNLQGSYSSGNSTLYLIWSTRGIAPVGYKVYRNTSPTPIDDLGEPVATMSSSVYWYEDTDVVEGEAYYYRVSSVGESGEEAFSAELKAQKLVAPYNVTAKAIKQATSDIMVFSSSPGNGMSITPYLNGVTDDSILEYSYDLEAWDVWSGGGAVGDALYIRAVKPIDRIDLYGNLDVRLVKWWDVGCPLRFGSSISLPNHAPTNVTSFRGMFMQSGGEFDISMWDTSGVTDMSYMFQNSYVSSVDVSLWDTSNVKDMSYLFYQSSFIDVDVSLWDVSNVKDMSYMFYHSSNNKDLSNWDMSGVEDTSYMFYNASADVNFTGWNLTNVKNMSYMFYQTTPKYPLSTWTVSGVTDTSYMFYNVNNFNDDISHWDMSKLENCEAMFWQASSFSQDISSWDVSNVKNMSRMFYNAGNINENLSSWDTSSVEDMSYMFYNIQPANPDVTSWDISNVVSTEGMFMRAIFFDRDIGGWDVSGIQNINNMLNTNPFFNQDLSSWDVSHFEKIPLDFGYSTGAWALPRPNWNVPVPQNMELSVSGPISVSWYDPAAWYGAGGGNPAPVDNYWIQWSLDGVDWTPLAPGYTPIVIGPESVGVVTKLYIRDLGPAYSTRYFRVENSANSQNNFNGVDAWWNSYTPIELNVANNNFFVPPTAPKFMAIGKNMFKGATAFNQDISEWDVSNVTTLESMFEGAYTFNQDIGGWDVSNVTTFESMFEGASAFNQDIGEWVVTKATVGRSMDYMFRNATNFNQDLSSWCVPTYRLEPYIFSTGATSWTLPKPIWGTCPSGDQ